MNIALKATITEDIEITGSQLLNFNNVVKKTDDIETDPSGTAFKLLRTKPLLFNVAVASRDGSPLDLTLFKNGAPLKSLAVSQSFAIVSAVDTQAAKGDVYGIQIGVSVPLVVNSEPVFTSLEIIG